jgi:hypothetical protein
MSPPADPGTSRLVSLVAGCSTRLTVAWLPCLTIIVIVLVLGDDIQLVKGRLDVELGLSLAVVFLVVSVLRFSLGRSIAWAALGGLRLLVLVWLWFGLSLIILPP